MCSLRRLGPKLDGSAHNARLLGAETPPRQLFGCRKIGRVRRPGSRGGGCPPPNPGVALAPTRRLRTLYLDCGCRSASVWSDRCREGAMRQRNSALKTSQSGQFVSPNPPHPAMPKSSPASTETRVWESLGDAAASCAPSALARARVGRQSPPLRLVRRSRPSDAQFSVRWLRL